MSILRLFNDSHARRRSKKDAYPTLGCNTQHATLCRLSNLLFNSPTFNYSLDQESQWKNRFNKDQPISGLDGVEAPLTQFGPPSGPAREMRYTATSAISVGNTGGY
ncbi:hypothetical protein EVAR_38511_1 [Eumeta japonica]|uniref:Uncharacterized protein n=1 Tax=Eumeta variegata TaxID=151549 RepID=A0A4C1WDI7_EUMVA|nr:hypothetical protein EVAR_38511_1 [Eumeta japonica]